MRRSSRCSPLWRLPLALLLVVAAARGARAGDPPVSAPNPPAPKPGPPAAAKDVTLPPGIVARVRGQDVTLAEFRLRLADAVRDEIDEPRSGPATVLAVVIEETVVRQEADRLGIRVTNEDYAKRYDELNTETRIKSRGTQTLEDVMREMKTPPEEFRARLEDLIRKDRIASDPSHLGATLPKEPNARLAQVEIVIGELMKKAKIEKTGLPAGVVAKVNGSSISAERYGEQLYLRLAESEVRRRLQEYCLSVVLSQEGLQFTSAQAHEALELERPLWTRMVDEAIDAAHRSIGFDDFLALRYNAPRTELETSAYRRGLFALRMREWKKVTEDEIAAEWVRGAERQYGATITVTEFILSFQNAKALGDARRTKAEAQRLAADVVRRGRGGESAAALLREVMAAKDRSFVARRRAMLRQGDNGNDMLLFDAVARLPDGSWAEPVESLSEFHALCRESARPAPTLEKLRDVVRHDIVDLRAREWLQRVMNDQVTMSR